MHRYNIRHLCQVWNLDQSGVCFRANGRRTKRKKLRLKHKKCTKDGWRPRKLTTWLSCRWLQLTERHSCLWLNTLVYQANYRKVRGLQETFHGHLIPCYLHQRDPDGVASFIFYKWADSFIQEVILFREIDENILHVYDGYICLLQYLVIKLFRENNIFVVCPPAHSSHVLQPLDLSIFY